MLISEVVSWSSPTCRVRAERAATHLVPAPAPTPTPTWSPSSAASSRAGRRGDDRAAGSCSPRTGRPVPVAPYRSGRTGDAPAAFRGLPARMAADLGWNPAW